MADYRALAEFRYHIRRFLHFSEEAVAKAGLEKGQYQCLLAIKGVPADCKPSVGELARQMQVRHHSAVELADRLETNGLIRRARDPQDKRQVLLALTPKGERVLENLALHHREELRGATVELVDALRKLQR